VVDIFCDFNATDDIVYTYFSLDTLNLVSDLSVHYNRYDHAKIRLLTDSNKQREAIVRQHPLHEDRYNVSVYVNGHTGFDDTRCKIPLLYLGFLPRAFWMHTEFNPTHGLTVNNHTIEYSACDDNRSNRIVICKEYKTDTRCSLKTFGNELYDNTVYIGKDISLLNQDKYFGRFEIAFGGCGTLLNDNCVNNVKAMSIGLPFKFK